MKRYRDLNSYFREIFGCRVHKITVDAGLNCPNRDGTISKEGCIFCNERGSGTGAFRQGLSIGDQLVRAKTYLSKRYKAKKFIAYFQSYTNTHAPLEKLEKLYREALSVEDIVGLSIGTRPDCIDESILDLLAYHAETRMIWIEYGLQSIHDKTLRLINRGHNFDTFAKAIEMTRGRGILTCAHVILGLPGETREDMLKTADYVSKSGLDGIKVHLLYVIKGTRLESLFLKGSYRCLTQMEYVELVCSFLERLHPDMVIQRLTGDPHPEELTAPLWALKKSDTLNLIRQTLETRDSRQGKFFAGTGTKNL